MSIDFKKFSGSGMTSDSSRLKLISELKKQGSVVVFPAYHWHRVKPITKGTRYSLVIWSLGERFC